MVVVYLLGGGLPAPFPDLSQQIAGQLAWQLHHNLATRPGDQALMWVRMGYSMEDA